MKTVHQWFEEYSQSHQNRVNKAIHWVCVPLIFFSIVCLLFSVRIADRFSLATVIMLLTLVFYFRLSSAIALGMLAMYVFSLFAIKALLILFNPQIWMVGLVIFALARIGQWIGHRMEGSKTSFLKDLQYLLIGPAWILGQIYRKLGIKY